MKIRIIVAMDKNNGIGYQNKLPWHFKDHIVKREQKFLKNGGKLIFPLPDIEIV